MLRVAPSGVPIPVGARYFSYPEIRPEVYHNGYRSSYSGVKRPGWGWGGEVNPSPPSSAEVKNEWSNTPLPLHASMAWTRTTSLLQLNLTHPNSN